LLKGENNATDGDLAPSLGETEKNFADQDFLMTLFYE